jgi:hypothetical protein
VRTKRRTAAKSKYEKKFKYHNHFGFLRTQNFDAANSQTMMLLAGDYFRVRVDAFTRTYLPAVGALSTRIKGAPVPPGSQVNWFMTASSSMGCMVHRNRRR